MLVSDDQMVAVKSFGMVLALAVAACSRGAGPDTASVPTAATISTASTTTTTVANTSGAPTTTSTTTTSSSSTTTTPPTPESTPYAVVAWERGNRLVILGVDPEPEPCPEEGDAPCGPMRLLGQVEVPAGPHNTAAFGGVALATHPREGMVSRYEAATGEVLVASVGAEPHDVDFSPDGSRAYVADESGRRLLVLDPATLEPIEEIPLPGEPHDMVVRDGEVWVTMIGRSELARVDGGEVAIQDVGGAPHDITVDGSGQLWLTHWGSARLSVFDQVGGALRDYPSDIAQPHHFAVDPGGNIWVSDNVAAAVVGLPPEGPVTIDVGPVPHHLAFTGDLLVVAVSDTGKAVMVRDGSVVGRVPIGAGLHGVSTGTVEGSVTIP